MFDNTAFLRIFLQTYFHTYFEFAPQPTSQLMQYSFKGNIKIRYKVSILTLVEYPLEFNLGLLSAYKLMRSIEVLYQKKLVQFEIMENQLPMY